MEKGYVYLLTDFDSFPEKFKIGITKQEPEKRIKQLQTGCSGEIVLLRTYKSKFYKKIEKFLHRKYKKYNSNGGTEWFELPDEEVLTFIEECENAEKMFIPLIDNPFM